MAEVNFTENDYRLNQTSNVNAKRAIQGKGADEMDMNDFMNLLVAQMTNQDMMNPQENTEFVAQMAQFTTLQGMQTIQEYQLSSYAVSYVGKDVTIAKINDYTGEMETFNGTVDSVNFYNGSPQVVVNGKTYPLYTIMEVKPQGSSTNSSNSINDAAQYVGKTVNVIHENEYGYPESITGEVTHVTMTDGVPHVVIDYKEYPVSEIQSIVDGAWLKAQQEANRYMGENVRIRQENPNGSTTEITGEVTGAKVIEGKPYVTIDGKDYPVSAIQAVLSNEDLEVMRRTQELKTEYLNQNVNVHHTDEDGNQISFSGDVTDIFYRDGQYYATVEGSNYPIESIG